MLISMHVASNDKFIQLLTNKVPPLQISLRAECVSASQDTLEKIVRKSALRVPGAQGVCTSVSVLAGPRATPP